jgi:RimJ/RimL family protein N-acetyltransferase
MDKPGLHSERLTGSPAGPEHLATAVELFGDSAVAEWIWPGELGGPRTPEQVGEILDRQVAAWRTDGFGWWWWQTHDGEPIGEAGLQRTFVGGRLVVEVGWTLLPRHWGHGYASEAAAAAMRFGFERAGLAELHALTLPGNVRSLAVMDRLGMKPVGPVEHAGLTHEVRRLRLEDPRDRAAVD